MSQTRTFISGEDIPQTFCLGCWPSRLMLHYQTDHVDQTGFYSISMPLIGPNHWSFCLGEGGDSSWTIIYFSSLYGVFKYLLV